MDGPLPGGFNAGLEEGLTAWPGPAGEADGLAARLAAGVFEGLTAWLATRLTAGVGARGWHTNLRSVRVAMKLSHSALSSSIVPVAASNMVVEVNRRKKTVKRTSSVLHSMMCVRLWRRDRETQGRQTKA
jgi:hypothetical protein